MRRVVMIAVSAIALASMASGCRPAEGQSPVRPTDSSHAMDSSEPFPVTIEPAREFSGVWLDTFEGSPFLEGAIETPASVSREQYFAAWLNIDPQLVGVLKVPAGKLDCYPVTSARLKFIGRRSVRPDPKMIGFGHMGVSRSEISVDRLISFEQIPSPPCGPEVILPDGRSR